MPKNASGLETEAHRAEHSFFDMTGNTNVYDYITTEGKITGKKSGRITALEYLQKSTGVFNGNGLLSEERIAGFLRHAIGRTDRDGIGGCRGHLEHL